MPTRETATSLNNTDFLWMLVAGACLADASAREKFDSRVNLDYAKMAPKGCADLIEATLSKDGTKVWQFLQRIGATKPSDADKGYNAIDAIVAAVKRNSAGGCCKAVIDRLNSETYKNDPQALKDALQREIDNIVT